MQTFQFPNLVTGEFVDYRQHPGATPMPMMVMLVGDDSIEGCVFIPNGGVGFDISYVSGVRHVDDPRLLDPAFTYALMQEGDAGVFSESQSKLLLNRRLTALEDALHKIVTGKKKEAEETVAAIMAARPEESHVAVVLPNEAPVEVVKMAERFKTGTVDPDAKAAALSAARA